MILEIGKSYINKFYSRICGIYGESIQEVKGTLVHHDKISALSRKKGRLLAVRWFESNLSHQITDSLEIIGMLNRMPASWSSI